MVSVSRLKLNVGRVLNHLGVAPASAAEVEAAMDEG
jgi:hypothetical protein